MDILASSAQRRMTVMVRVVGTLPSEERLKLLNLHCLERRRLQGNLIKPYKWVDNFNNGKVDRVMMVN